jgi:hypothetical protein
MNESSVIGCWKPCTPPPIYTYLAKRFHEHIRQVSLTGHANDAQGNIQYRFIDTDGVKRTSEGRSACPQLYRGSLGDPAQSQRVCSSR